MSDEDCTKEEKNDDSKMISEKDLSEKRRSSIGSTDEKPPERPTRKKQFSPLKKIRRASSANIMNAFNLSSNKTESPARRKSVSIIEQNMTKKRILKNNLQQMEKIEEVPTAKKGFMRSISTSSLLKVSIPDTKKRRLRKRSTIAALSVIPQEVSLDVDIDSDEDLGLDYSVIAKQIHKSFEEESIKEEMDIHDDIEIEFGKADFESIEYTQDIIIQEIESGVYLGPALRAVYEGNDHTKFLHRLDSRIKQHDKDIEKMCNFHYQGFIDSITELINVRGDAKKLKNQTIAINKELHDSGKEVMDKSDTLIQCRLQQRNVVAAIEKLTICLPILQMYAKICDQMKEERYYAALKTLEQLETTYLPQVFQYRFCEIMKNDIPTIRDTIRQKSTLILNNFLENVRSKSNRIGKVAMNQVEKESCLDEKIRQDNEIVSNNYNSTSQISENDLQEEDLETDQSLNNPFLDTDNDEQHSNKIENVEKCASSDLQVILDAPNTSISSYQLILSRKKSVNEIVSSAFKWKIPRHWKMIQIDADLSASDIVDFSPVYKCLHIFGLINLRSWFEDYYRKQRRKQVELILESVSNLGAVETYTKMFHEVVGFFVVEDHILHTAQNLVTQSYICELWNMVLLMLLNKLAPNQINLPDAHSMMKIKNSIVIFADTLKAYGFTVDRLFSLLMEMRDTYGEMMLNLWQERFANVFSEDNYTPIYLETIDDVDDCLLAFPCEFNFVEASKYPKKLPFSLFVPKIYSEIKEFILACLKYCEDLHLSSTEVDDMIRKSTNLLLTKTLSCGLKTLVQKPSLGLNQLVQIIVNTTHLENSCPYVEEYVRKITGVKAGNAHSAKLVGVSTFKDARSETETQIYTKLNEKIDAFFELADYDWTMNEPQGLASRYLVDLISFLRTTFQVFTTLPANVAQTACMSACRHISTCLTTLILDTGIKEITVPALHQFNLDVVQCEHFANSEPVPGFDDGVLQMSFTEIRQLLDLILTWDWTSYFADYATPKSKYLRVNPAIALSLFEKIKQEQGGALAYFTPSGRGKKRINDQVHKQLRNLVSEKSFVKDEEKVGKWNKFLNMVNA